MNNGLTKVFYCLCLLCLLSACVPTGIQVDDEGPFTHTGDNDIFDNAVPVKIDADVLQKCYGYTESLGYIIKDKDNYKSVILGESHIESVHLQDDANSNMLDKNDYLILFDEIRIVIDADTGIVLGNIPYV